MFSAFFFKFTLCEPFALYILREEEKITRGKPTSHSKSAGFDKEFVHSSLLVREYASFSLQTTSNGLYFRISGEGRALGDTQLAQDKAYFEVKVLRKGHVRVGVSKISKEGLDLGVGMEGESWGIGFGEQVGNFPAAPSSIIGCLVDQSDFPAQLSYTLNGQALEGAQVIGLRGPLVPAVSVAAGAEIEVAFQAELLSERVPVGYAAIIPSRNYVF